MVRREVDISGRVINKPVKMNESALLAFMRGAEEKGLYRFVSHAEKRLSEREVTVGEVRQILRTGYHEKKKDEWKDDHKAWNYPFRGQTLDGRSLRIAVTILKPNLLVITVIDLET